MKIGEYELPDKCPKDCPHKDDLYKYGQSAICGRCPVLVCTPCDGMCLVDAADYRTDWAKAWHDWFEGGMKGWVELRFKIGEE